MVVEFKVGEYDFVIDDIDADLLQWKWRPDIKKRDGALPYAMRSTHFAGMRRSRLSLHRIILSRLLGRELLPTEKVDHKDTDSKNNTRSNLRLATNAQNAANRKVSKSNRLGVKGVTQIKSGKFVANIGVNYRNVYLGTFEKLEDAQAAYLQAAKKYFGDFARGE